MRAGGQYVDQGQLRTIDQARLRTSRVIEVIRLIAAIDGVCSQRVVGLEQDMTEGGNRARATVRARKEDRNAPCCPRIGGPKPARAYRAARPAVRRLRGEQRTVATIAVGSRVQDIEAGQLFGHARFGQDFIRVEDPHREIARESLVNRSIEAWRLDVV